MHAFHRRVDPVGCVPYCPWAPCDADVGSFACTFLVIVSRSWVCTKETFELPMSEASYLRGDVVPEGVNSNASELAIRRGVEEAKYLLLVCSCATFDLEPPPGTMSQRWTRTAARTSGNRIPTMRKVTRQVWLGQRTRCVSAGTICSQPAPRTYANQSVKGLPRICLDTTPAECTAFRAN